MSNTAISYQLKARDGNLREIIIKFSFGFKEVNTLTGKTNYKPLRYDSGVKITDDSWDYSNQRPSRPTDFMKVLQVQEKLETLYRNLVDTGVYITPEVLKDKLDIRLGRKKKTISTTVIADYIFETVLEREVKKEENNYKYKKQTRKNYRSLRNRILEFEKDTNLKLTAESMNKETYLMFQQYCRNRAKKNNTAWTFMKNLTAVLRKIKKQYEIPVFEPSKELEKSQIMTDKLEDKVYFDFEDIQILLDHKASTERLQRIKWILLTLLFSGARYSDVFKVIPQFEYKKSGISFKYAHFLTTKNPTEVVVPFMQPLDELWKKNEIDRLPRLSDQKFNSGVKELCKEAGFTQLRKIAFTNSHGEKEFEVKPFYSFVSSHIGRRSFVTNFINVLSPLLITKITGHQFKMTDVVFKYNKITPLKSAVLFMKFAKKLYDDEDWKDEFPIKLAA